MGVTAQPLAFGLIVKVTFIGAADVFVRLPLILPDPLAAIPVAEAELSLDQLYIIPVGPPLKAILVVPLPEQVVCAAGVATAWTVGKTRVVNGSTEQGAIESSLYTSR